MLFSKKFNKKHNFPPRKQFDSYTMKWVKHVFDYYSSLDQDFGFQGHFESLYTDEFNIFQGGGYSDAVCSGSAGIFVAINSLQLPVKSEIVISGVTDPGTISAVLLAGHIPILIDSDIGQFNISFKQFKLSVTKNTTCAILTHVGGIPIDILEIQKYARENSIKLIEDCSQAHGSEIYGKKVGTFGDIAVFSTMFSKNHSTGGCGGLVFTQDEKLYWKIREHSDRGKPFNDENFEPKNPSNFRGPALNLNQDELSCAIGISNLRKLKKTIYSRKQIADEIAKGLENISGLSMLTVPYNSNPSYFFLTIKFQKELFNVSKYHFTERILSRGIPINPNYCYILSDWKWLRKYNISNSSTPNSISFRDMSFNLLFNEKFKKRDINRILETFTELSKEFLS